MRIGKLFLAVIFTVLIGLGSLALVNGKTGMGMGLIAGSVAAFTARTIKMKRVRRLEERGLNPYDERVQMISGKAAYAGYVTFIIASSIVVVIGSVIGPVMSVNLYDALGTCLALLVLLYVGYFYYYSYKM
ncbi:MAG TPA: hypothetical protein GXX39_04005 [Syntrophothermus lipocalidus]|nr:hypothetical protein [Syntrophothermus lipocalidus]